MSDTTIIIDRTPLDIKSVPMVCSWCGKTFRINTWRLGEKKINKSHGICGDCYKKNVYYLMRAEQQTTKKKRPLYKRALRFLLNIK